MYPRLPLLHLGLLVLIIAETPTPTSLFQCIYQTHLQQMSVISPSWSCAEGHVCAPLWKDYLTGSGTCVQAGVGPGVISNASCQTGVNFSLPCLQRPNCSAHQGCVQPHVGSSSSYCVPNDCITGDFCVFGAPSDQCQGWSDAVTCMQFSPAGKCLPQQCTVPTVGRNPQRPYDSEHICNPLATNLGDPWSCCADPDAICTTTAGAAVGG